MASSQPSGWQTDRQPWRDPGPGPLHPKVVCGALVGAMTVGDACEVAQRQTPGLGVAVPYAVTNVLLTVLGPRNIGLTFAG